MVHNGNNVRIYTRIGNLHFVEKCLLEIFRRFPIPGKGNLTSWWSVSWKYFGDFLYPEKGTSLRYEVLPLQEIFRSVLTAGYLKIHHNEQNNAFGKPARVLDPWQYLSFECWNPHVQTWQDHKQYSRPPSFSQIALTQASFSRAC